MQNSSAGILMKSLKNKPQRGHSDFVWLSLRIDKLRLLCSVVVPLLVQGCDRQHSENCTVKLITGKSAKHLPPSILALRVLSITSVGQTNCIICKINPISKLGEAWWAQEDRTTSSTTQAPACLMEVFVRLKLCRIALIKYNYNCWLQSGGHSLSEISR